MPSSVIRSFEYDEASRTLTITFQSGRRYRYFDVPASTVRALQGAESKGGFFNSEIRGRFAYQEEAARTRRAASNAPASRRA